VRRDASASRRNRKRGIHRAAKRVAGDTPRSQWRLRVASGLGIIARPAEIYSRCRGGEMKRLVVAITGASGAAYGVRILELLSHDPDWETHLVISAAGALTVRQELDRSPASVAALADRAYRPADIGASIASGSFETAGMIVAPCSVKTLSAIAHCYSDNLIARAGDVNLKEGRPLVLMVRETPLHARHLKLMAMAAEAGAVVAPPVPAWYAHPASVDDIVDDSCRRVLARVGIPVPTQGEWPGLSRQRARTPDASRRQRSVSPARARQDESHDDGRLRSADQATGSTRAASHVKGWITPPGVTCSSRRDVTT
jgi:4-hydroxy-3-polyprenylbenzoate decarboxylase